MKVTIEVPKKEAAELVERWGYYDRISDGINATGRNCVRLARAIKRMEKEGK